MCASSVPQSMHPQTDFSRPFVEVLLVMDGIEVTVKQLQFQDISHSIEKFSSLKSKNQVMAYRRVRVCLV
jgi:hypothetical protein